MIAYVAAGAAAGTPAAAAGALSALHLLLQKTVSVFISTVTPVAAAVPATTATAAAAALPGARSLLPRVHTFLRDALRARTPCVPAVGRLRHGRRGERRQRLLRAQSSARRELRSSNLSV